MHLLLHICIYTKNTICWIFLGLKKKKEKSQNNMEETEIPTSIGADKKTFNH